MGSSTRRAPAKSLFPRSRTSSAPSARSSKTLRPPSFASSSALSRMRKITFLHGFHRQASRCCQLSSPLPKQKALKTNSRRRKQDQRPGITNVQKGGHLGRQFEIGKQKFVISRFKY